MPVDSPAEPALTTDAASTPRRGRVGRLGRAVIAAVVVGLVAMWAYVLYLAFGPGRQPPVDRLDDPTFAGAAESRCAEALDQLEELPFASELPTATRRAEVLDQANAIFATMLDDLDDRTTLAPAGDQRERVERWLADWRILLGNRIEYAEALRSDPNARLLVSEKGDTGRHITGWIDEFAAANRMPSCETPPDV